MTDPRTEPHFGEEAADQPSYGEEAAGQPDHDEGDKTASGAGTDEERNPDLHGEAREVAEGSSDDVAETPGGG